MNAKSVLSHRRMISNDSDDVTNGDKEFQTLAAETGNARSPIVGLEADGTTSAADDADRNRNREHLSHAVTVGMQPGTTVQLDHAGTDNGLRLVTT